MIKLRILLIIIIIVGILVADFSVVLAAGDDDKTVFSFEKDGYWKPSDSISRDFTVKNIWGKECYLDYITFNNTYIKDISTLKEYSVEEAVDYGIINDYKVIISLNDANEGKEILFKGSMQELCNAKIELKEKLFMELDSVVTFNISITLDALASNEYQNKSYQYILQPSAFEITKPVNGVKLIKDKKLFILNEYIELQDGYSFGDDRNIYDEDGNKYTEEEYIKKVGLIGVFALLLKTGDANMMLGVVTIILLIGSFIVMIMVRRRKV